MVQTFLNPLIIAGFWVLTLKTFIMKTSQILISKVSVFFNQNTSYLKLSDFYNRMTTKYAGCLNDLSMFEHITDKEKIVSLGFDKRVKTVLHLNVEHPLIIQILDDLSKQKHLEITKRKEQERLFEKMVNNAKNIITNNPEIFQNFWNKSIEKYQRTCSKQEQYVAWKMSTKFPECTKTAFFHAI